MQTQKKKTLPSCLLFILPEVTLYWIVCVWLVLQGYSLKNKEGNVRFDTILDNSFTNTLPFIHLHSCNKKNTSMWVAIFECTPLLTTNLSRSNPEKQAF